MHLEAAIMSLRYALGGRDRGSLEIHLEAMIRRDWRSTWRRSIGGAPDAETPSIS